MLSSLLLKKSTQVDAELDALFRDAAVKQASGAKHDADDDDDDDDGSESLVDKPLKTRGRDSIPKRKPEAQQEAPTAKRTKRDVGSDSGSEADPSTLIHESLVDKPRNWGSKPKYIPSDESPAQKDQRTIFIGNLPLQVAQKRPLQKQLQRHILSFIPSAKIESTRFRSVPFNTPTSNLSATPTTTTTATTTTTTQNHKNPSQRDHDRTRASSWKSKESTTDPQSENTKQFLNPSQKKKIAFINHEFHNTADTVHAYIVFAYPTPPDSRPKNLPPLSPVMDPFIAAKEVVKKADASLFMERVIRVDSVGTKTLEGDADEGDIGSLGDADIKCTLFVGNLEFTSEEGDLRTFFETLIKTEHGDAPHAPQTDANSTEKNPHTWVKRVRIIKDKETQLGKGFAYVQFIDRECVDTLLTFSPDQLKFAKRKLRINRCKTIQGNKLSSAIKSKLSQPSSTPSSSKDPKLESKRSPHPKRSSRMTDETIEIPKGDPSLGTKLAHLSKEQRKQAKASDADRVARRLAKKKARMVMGTAVSSVGDGLKKHSRERVRKTTMTGGGAGAGGKRKQDLVKKKGRVRSEKSLEKRNMKK